MAAKSYFQSHTCDGFRAKVTIEWELSDKVDEGCLPAWRLAECEDIADSIMRFAAGKTRDMVQRMRGYRNTVSNGYCPSGGTDEH